MLSLWFPKLQTGALVIFHDVEWAEGVQQIVREEVVPRRKKKAGFPTFTGPGYHDWP